MPALKPKVFVYGTLKSTKGGVLRKKKNSTFVGRGLTQDDGFTMCYSSGTGFGFPFLFYGLEGKQKAHVEGEIYSVTNSILEELDSIEGVPNLYIRVKIPVISYVDGRVLKCWMYINSDEFFNEDYCPLVYVPHPKEKDNIVKAWSF